MSTLPPQAARILLAHGSRDPVWQQGLRAVAAEMQRRAPDVPVACAFIELCAPTLVEVVRDLVEQGVATAVVTPYFLGMGTHGRQDLPRLVQEAGLAFPQFRLHCQPLVGEEPALITVLADLALRPLASTA